MKCHNARLAVGLEDMTPLKMAHLLGCRSCSRVAGWLSWQYGHDAIPDRIRERQGYPLSPSPLGRL